MFNLQKYSTLIPIICRVDCLTEGLEITTIAEILMVVKETFGALLLLEGIIAMFRLAQVYV